MTSLTKCTKSTPHLKSLLILSISYFSIRHHSRTETTFQKSSGSKYSQHIFLLKGERGIFNVQNNLSECHTCEGETGTDENAQVLTPKKNSPYPCFRQELNSWLPFSLHHQNSALTIQLQIVSGLESIRLKQNLF